MEKPSGLIEKVIDTLHLVNSIQGPYSLIEKDIILQHLRAAYLQLLNAPAVEQIERESIMLPSIENEVVSDEKQNSYIQQIEELNQYIAQLEEEAIGYKNDLDSTKNLFEAEKGKSQNSENQMITLHKTVDSQKAEIASLLSDLDTKDAQMESLKKQFEFEKEEQIKTIDKLKKELELVLLREEIYDPTTEQKETQSPQTPVIEETEVIQEKEIPLEEVDDILEFINPNIPKQEVKTKLVEPQPLLFVEEIAAPTVEKKSLNDLLTEKKEDNSIGSRFQQSKIQDLTKAISINDKFLFIRELFKSKGEEFSASLHRLNNCATIEEAFNVMEELKNYYFWDTTSSAYLSLCDLVRRKFL